MEERIEVNGDSRTIRLRSRGLVAKRSLALARFARGLETLDRSIQPGRCPRPGDGTRGPSVVSAPGTETKETRVYDSYTSR